jgi:hypothetical protein
MGDELDLFQESAREEWVGRHEEFKDFIVKSEFFCFGLEKPINRQNPELEKLGAYHW